VRVYVLCHPAVSPTQNACVLPSDKGLRGLLLKILRLGLGSLRSSWAEVSTTWPEFFAARKSCMSSFCKRDGDFGAACAWKASRAGCLFSVNVQSLQRAQLTCRTDFVNRECGLCGKGEPSISRAGRRAKEVPSRGESLRWWQTGRITKASCPTFVSQRSVASSSKQRGSGEESCE
jgi:hypothetical protein